MTLTVFLSLIFASLASASYSYHGHGQRQKQQGASEIPDISYYFKRYCPEERGVLPQPQGARPNALLFGQQQPATGQPSLSPNQASFGNLYRSSFRSASTKTSAWRGVGSQQQPIDLLAFRQQPELNNPTHQVVETIQQPQQVKEAQPVVVTRPLVQDIPPPEIPIVRQPKPQQLATAQAVPQPSPQENFAQQLETSFLIILEKTIAGIPKEQMGSEAARLLLLLRQKELEMQAMKARHQEILRLAANQPSIIPNAWLMPSAVSFGANPLSVGSDPQNPMEIKAAIVPMTAQVTRNPDLTKAAESHHAELVILEQLRAQMEQVQTPQPQVPDIHPSAENSLYPNVVQAPGDQAQGIHHQRGQKRTHAQLENQPAQIYQAIVVEFQATAQKEHRRSTRNLPRNKRPRKSSHQGPK